MPNEQILAMFLIAELTSKIAKSSPKTNHPKAVTVNVRNRTKHPDAALWPRKKRPLRQHRHLFSIPDEELSRIRHTKHPEQGA